ncbi:hypothetical protein FQN54_009461 [Arachnomyces sp. PD_36]|nr:hypothetical protein FQN54_009461 [Arachnomyces sp. PD_36]
MTASAVGHRPPETAPEMSLYDFCGSQHHQEYKSPRNESAVCSATNGSRERVEEPQDSLSGVSEEYRKQKDLEKQSAASSLLAQLLGNQSKLGGSDATPAQKVEETGEEQANTALQDLPPSLDPSPAIAQENTQEVDRKPSLPESNDNKPAEGQTDVSTNNTAFQKDTFSNFADINFDNPFDPFTDKAKPEQQNNLLPADFPRGAPRDALEALQQNDMLTSMYFSSLSSLPEVPGYSQPDMYAGAAASVAGSEPRIQAFAKLEFDDGHFYVNTYSFVLGRDVRAARAAFQREVQIKQAMGRNGRTKSSSGGNTSQTPNRVKREGSALVGGSVVSDRGGIMGFDPDVAPHMPPQPSRKSSNSSFAGSSQVTPAQLQSNQTDYNALAMQSLNENGGDARPVDTLALLPSPDSCPTIPIHPPANADGSAAGHRGISRKHVKIAYNFDKSLFEMEVIGRNGAFIGADWLAPAQIRPLYSGDYIQIGGVRIRFLLPDVQIGESGAERADESLVGEEELPVEETLEGNEVRAESRSELSENGESEDSEAGNERVATKLTLKLTKSNSAEDPKRKSSLDQSQDASQPARRRGPGRPPKDGIMSKRERAEIAREQKLAAKREANGGVTPPPSGKGKVGRPPRESGAEEPPVLLKPEKRKYTKRKKPESPTDIPAQSIEGGDPEIQPSVEEPPKPATVKKRKPSRSPSPNYPPESSYTAEDLVKPPYNYAVLIFDALTESPTPMTLKQIYRALKLKYPYFRFKCETEGWTSSVRHNLNGNNHLFMHAERDGKGWSWQLRPGASVEKEKKRRPSPPPASSQPSNNTSNYISQPPARTYSNTPNVPEHFRNQPYQFPPLQHNPYSAGSHPPQQQSQPQSQPQPPPPPPPPPPSQNPYGLTAAQLQLPEQLRNSLPAAFAAPAPSTYTSPYASAPPPPPPPMKPQPQHQQPQPDIHSQPRQSPYRSDSHPHQSIPGPPDPKSASPALSAPPTHHNQSHTPNPNHNPQNLPPAPQPQPQQSQHYSSSFTARANKAIDDFEAVLVEDYQDKDYIREVLRSARDRVLNGAQESSVKGGEPKDEAVLVDALRGIIGSLKDE